MPKHFERICSAIAQLPSYLDFDVPSLPETGPSQGLESHDLSQDDDTASSIADHHQSHARHFIHGTRGGEEAEEEKRGYEIVSRASIISRKKYSDLLIFQLRFSPRLTQVQARDA